MNSLSIKAIAKEIFPPTLSNFIKRRRASLGIFYIRRCFEIGRWIWKWITCKSGSRNGEALFWENYNNKRTRFVLITDFCRLGIFIRKKSWLSSILVALHELITSSKNLYQKKYLRLKIQFIQKLLKSILILLFKKKINFNFCIF